MTQKDLETRLNNELKSWTDTLNGLDAATILLMHSDEYAYQSNAIWIVANADITDEQADLIASRTLKDLSDFIASILFDDENEAIRRYCNMIVREQEAQNERERKKQERMAEYEELHMEFIKKYGYDVGDGY